MCLEEVAPGYLSRCDDVQSENVRTPHRILWRKSLEAAASSLAVEILRSPVGDREEIQKVMSGLGQNPDAGLIVVPQTFSLLHKPSAIWLQRWRPTVVSQSFIL